MIGFAEVTVGGGGLPVCRSCGSAAPMRPSPAESVRAEIETACADWDIGPGPNIAFVGGDVLSHPQLPQLVDAALASGAERIRLLTTAHALGQRGNASGALKAGIRHLEVPLLAGDAGAHDALCGAPGAFDATCSGVDAFTQGAEALCMDVAVVGRVRVCRHTVAHVPGAVAAFARMGAVAVTLDVTDGAAKSTGTSDWLNAAAETGTVNRVWVTITGLSQGVESIHRRPVSDVTRSSR